MKEAFELGFLTAYLHLKGECFPEIYYIDDVNFLAPVDVGSALKMDSQITYVHENIVGVHVECKTITKN